MRYGIRMLLEVKKLEFMDFCTVEVKDKAMRQYLCFEVQ